MVLAIRLGTLSLFAAVVLSATGGATMDTRVADAAKAADKSAVRALLARHVDANIPQPDGNTALHWAAQHDDAELAGILIRAGANVQAANRYGVTPLALASENGSAKMVDLLLGAHADPNSALPEGETALMTAARTGNVQAVRALLSHDAKVNAKEAWHGETALMWAAAENHPEVVRALIDRGADVHAHSDAVGFTPSNEGYLPGPFLPAGSFTSLLFAIRGGHIDCVKILLAAGADVNESLPNGATALTVAIMNAHFELAALLLDKGADAKANAPGWTPLHQLVWSRNPNRHFNLPPAVPDGNLDSLELAKLLLAHGADPNAQMTKEPLDGFRNWMSRNGATPFILAAKAADPALMRLLIAHGADPKAVTKDHTTALMAAAGIGFWPAESPGTESESLEAVKLAFELAGGDVNATNDGGFTALHGAAVHGTNSVVQFLFDKGAKLDVKTVKEKWTPLAIADGVFIANTYKATPQTAILLRQLMGETAR